MTKRPTAFLDANVLFSAALGGDAFTLLFDLGRKKRIRLITSSACEIEARTNLERKRPDKLARLSSVMKLVAITTADHGEHLDWASELIHPDDVHVLAAARASGASVLITGDVRDFGHLMNRTDVVPRIRTPRAFLLDGPDL